MLEVLASFISSLMMAILGYFIINSLIETKKSQVTIRNVLLIIIMAISSTFIQNYQTAGLHTFIIFCINIIIYKRIFKLNLSEAVISTVIAMFVIFISDMIISIMSVQFFKIETVKANPPILILMSVLIMLITIALFNIGVIKNNLKKFYINAKMKNKVSEIIFLSLIIIVVCILVYNIYENFKFNIDYLLNIGIIALLTLLTFIFINSKNSYNKLSIEYDSLFNYIQTFEDWIEKEQLNHHEYKNQLAVLRCLTKEKKVKNKIDEILEDNINVEREIINQVKGLPKGGIKGLIYYKVAVAQKNKVKLTIDVSLERKSILNNLSEKDIRVLCKLIGIYFDNAIEAAKDTKSKKILIEIYELKNRVNIVISNTFKASSNVKKINEKGVSTKGEGRGNGLYFASKLIKENNWLSQKQDVVDKYYIQELTVNKKNID